MQEVIYCLAALLWGFNAGYLVAASCKCSIADKLNGEKNNRDPSRYIESVLLISRMVGKQWGGAYFLPTRMSNKHKPSFLTWIGSGNASLQEGVQ